MGVDYLGFQITQLGDSDRNDSPNSSLQGVAVSFVVRGGIEHRVLVLKSKLDDSTMALLGPKGRLDPFSDEHSGIRVFPLSATEFMNELHNMQSPVVVPHDQSGRVDVTEIFPGWIAFRNASSQTLIHSVHSGDGWPTWNETWNLQTGKTSLDGFSGNVEACGSTNPGVQSTTPWSHAVSAITGGSYENDGESAGWSLVYQDSVVTAVIHRHTIDTTHFIDTWWLAAGFTWWGAASKVGILVSQTDKTTAQALRSSFQTSTRYKHTISPG